MHQAHWPLATLALTPALGGANHLAPVQVDVEATIAERPFHFAQ